MDFTGKELLDVEGAGCLQTSEVSQTNQLSYSNYNVHRLRVKYYKYILPLYDHEE